MLQNARHVSAFGVPGLSMKILMPRLSSSLLSISFFLINSNFYESRINLGKIFRIGINFLTFKKEKYENLKTKTNNGILTSKFEDLKLQTINLNKRVLNRPLGYLDIIDDNIIYLAGNGNILIIEDGISIQKTT